MRARRNTPAQNLIADLVAAKLPRTIARAEAIRVTALARDFHAGRMTLAEVRAQLRGDT